MSRPPRINAADAFYHLTTRGNRKQEIYARDSDREGFLELFAEIVAAESWICHAYCLMDNHYHLLIQTPDANLSHGMHRLNGRYARAFNQLHLRTGHLFERRFNDRLILDQDYLLEVARYDVLNPVRAGLCRDAGSWRWSSYRATAGLAACPPFLTTDLLLGSFHPHDKERAQARYRDFIAAGSPAASLAGILAA